MNLKKFTASTPRQALRMVRESLGDEAVILSNRSVGGVTEIVAMAGREMDRLVGQPSPAAAPAAATPVPQPAVVAQPTALPRPPEPAAREAGSERESILAMFARRRDQKRQDRSTAAEQAEARSAQAAAAAKASVQARTNDEAALSSSPRAAARPMARDDGEATGPIGRGSWQDSHQRPVAQDGPSSAFSIDAEGLNQAVARAASQPSVEAAHERQLRGRTVAAAGSNVGAPPIELPKAIGEVMSELRSMRSMMESQLTEIAWGTQSKREPARAAVMREMLSAGFSASLSRYLIERMPAEAAQDGLKWMQSILLRNLPVQTDEQQMIQRGGVFALVGPTGVGKTTTAAKLAARCVRTHGPGKLALITTDGYRIGGYEQLRIYGKILGVMVHAVKDEADLRIALAELSNKHVVLIDTAGVGQRDRMVAEQVALLQGTDVPVKRLLCLPATSTAETLNEVVRAHRGDGLAGCVLTKLDEAATLGNVLDVIIRQKLKLHYVANGQRVPEDLHPAHAHYLIDRAFKFKRETAPFQLLDEELPLLMGATAGARHDSGLSEVSFG